MGFPVKLLAPGERLVLLFRPHAKALIAPVVVLLVTAPVIAFLAGLTPAGSLQAPTRWALVVVGLLLLARWTVWPFLVWWNTVYVITNRRLVQRSGVFNRSGHDMPLSRVNDVKFSASLVERVLGCGTLVVESAGEVGQVVLEDAPRVEQLQRTLYRLSDHVRDQGAPDPDGSDVPDDLDTGDDLDHRGGDSAENPTRVLGSRDRELP